MLTGLILFSSYAATTAAMSSWVQRPYCVPQSNGTNHSQSQTSQTMKPNLFFFFLWYLVFCYCNRKQCTPSSCPCMVLFCSASPWPLPFTIFLLPVTRWFLSFQVRRCDIDVPFKTNKHSVFSALWSDVNFYVYHGSLRNVTNFSDEVWEPH